MRYWLIWLLLCGAYSIHAQEEILNFHVDIIIDSSSEIRVSESLRVRAEGNEIHRGIYRVLPLVRPGVKGQSEPAPIEILSVKKNGITEPYHVQKDRENMTLYMGDEDQLLEPGIYDYEIVYIAENQLSFFEEYDELYWNVIGAQWSFPVLEYSAAIYLPGGAEYLQGACYTGPPGSRQSECTLEARPEEGVVLASGTKRLAPREGFTVAVAWPKGYVKNAFARQLDLNYINIFLFLGGLAIFVFYGYYWWRRVGVDPEKPSVVPDWNPPDGLSPAEISYLYHRRINDKAVSAALIDAGVKGQIRIENHKKKFTFYRLNGSVDLEEEESALVNRLLPDANPFVLKSSNYSRYQSARKSFSQTLKSKLNISDYFLHNWRYVLKATLLMALVTTLALGAGMYPLTGSFLKSIFITFALVLFVFAFVSVPFHIHKWYRWIFVGLIWVVSCTLFVVVFVNALFFTFSYVWIAVMIGISSFMAGMFNYLIYAPTVLGQETVSKLEGFRMYLDKSEKEMLNYFTPPEKTPELFERMLPYAIALGVENHWSKKFEDVLSKAIAEGTYVPLWYTGNIHNINRLHSDLSSAVSSAAPKSSSGSGGGGFSGGGGGGGGGGGW